MIKRLSILITGFIPGLAMADTLTGAEMDFSGITLDFVNYVIPTATADVPEPSMPMLLAAAVGVGLAVKYIRRNK